MTRLHRDQLCLAMVPSVQSPYFPSYLLSFEEISMGSRIFRVPTRCHALVSQLLCFKCVPKPHLIGILPLISSVSFCMPLLDRERRY